MSPLLALMCNGNAVVDLLQALRAEGHLILVSTIISVPARFLWIGGDDKRTRFGKW